ncbi:MAG: hypothetical protein GW748_02665 [Alphaproteobacteria bacterium]|nr:hypothetical protein [Alphaproteobacteria bacterium]NCQ66630.1 hypothetical protein [Alphaproteobacteria bacterium]NCT06982.1 hypothetical protein [Alphaproteobacteria bacterium]
MLQESDLKIKGVGFPPLSCRDATQVLTPIRHGEMRRSVNGELCYVGTARHHKYRSHVICSDQNLPGIQQVWVGAIVEVDCISPLWETFLLQNEETTQHLSRPSVAGSLLVKYADNSPVDFRWNDGILTLPTGEGKTVIVSYRPCLKMRITSFDFKESEWQEGRSWRLGLEEI